MGFGNESLTMHNYFQLYNGEDTTAAAGDMKAAVGFLRPKGLAAFWNTVHLDVFVF